MHRRVLTALLAAAAGASAFFCYVSTFDNGFIWDDPIVLEQQMVAFKSVKDAFIPPQDIPQFGIFYYRPVVVVSYMIDRMFTGPRPMELPKGAINPFHVSVVIYHTIDTILVFFLGRLLFRSRKWGEWAALAGALLFAVHPIHTESVCWMAGRSDVLASLGLLPALLLYLTGRIRGGIGWFIGAAAAFLFGLWAKETGIAALLALPALDLVPLGLTQPAAAAAAAGKDADARRAKGRSVGRAVPSAAGGRTAPWTWRYGPFAAATIIYWFMRYSDLHRGVRGNESFSTLLFSTQLQAQKDKLFEMVLDLVGAIGFYVRKVTVPTNLNAFVADVPHDALTIIVGLAAIAGGVGLFLLARRKGARMIPALAALFFATIAPSFAIAMFDISEAPVAERYLYIPSIAACLGAGWLGGLLIEKVRERTGPAAARGALVAIATAGVAVFSAFAWSTSIRNETWHDDILFWQDAVSKAPHQGLPHLHLGLANDKLPWSSPEERKKLDDIAEREYLLALNPKIIYDVEGRSTALNNLGNVYMDQGRYDKGEECFRNSFGMRPSYPTPYYGMGLLMYRRALDSQKAGNGEQAWKQMTESRDWIDQALNRNPRYVKAFLMGGTVRFALRDEGGAKYLQQVVSLAPGTAEAAQAEKLIVRERANRAAQQKTPATPGGTGATAPGGAR